MAMFGSKVPPAEVGDRFTKVGDRLQKTWEVSRVWATADGIPHARLQTLERSSETMLVSVTTLADREFFAPYLPPPNSD